MRFLRWKSIKLNKMQRYAMKMSQKKADDFRVSSSYQWKTQQDDSGNQRIV